MTDPGLDTPPPYRDPKEAATQDELIRARRLCMGVFDVLWKDAWRLRCYSDGANDRDKRQAIQSAAKMRARHYIAYRLGVHPDACMPHRLRDLTKMRAFYRACQSVSAQQIRDWWIDMHPLSRLDQLKAGDRVRVRLQGSNNTFDAKVLRADNGSVLLQRITPTGRIGKQIELQMDQDEPTRLERNLIPIPKESA